MTDHPRVAVVGGGVAGLVAARELARSERLSVVLLEGDERLGGKVRSGALGGVPIELGPDSFVARDATPADLCRALGLGDRLVEPGEFGAYVWRAERLRAMPPGFVLGVPADPVALARARILSPRGVTRALADVVLPGPLRGGDVSVASFVRRRFGDEVLERLVDPILAGTRAGSTETMSLAAAASQIDEVARAERSVLLGLLRRRRAGAGGPPPFLGLRGGMEALVEALARDLRERAEIRLGAPVAAVSAHAGGYRLSAGGDEVEVDGVVLAAPAFAAASQLAELEPGAAQELRAISYASIATINLLYPAGAVALPPSGSGILVPSSEGRMLAGCTWVTRKWPHLAPRDGATLIRCFVGRGGADPVLDLDDEALLFRCHDELTRALRIEAAPSAARVARWSRAIPQYEVGHRERIDRIEAALGHHPALALAGAAYRGSGLSDCIAQGKAAAGGVLRALTSRPSA